jgi:hypothetical protein
MPLCKLVHKGPRQSAKGNKIDAGTENLILHGRSYLISSHSGRERKEEAQREEEEEQEGKAARCLAISFPSPFPHVFLDAFLISFSVLHALHEAHHYPALDAGAGNVLPSMRPQIWARLTLPCSVTHMFPSKKRLPCRRESFAGGPGEGQA